MSSLDEAKLRAYFEAKREPHLARMRQYLSQPSLPSENVGIKEGAELLASYYRELGCKEVEIIPNGDFPGVWAYYDAGAPKTLVNYCMFDTKPPAKQGWSTDPFAAAIVDHQPLGRAVVAPGACGRKGPYAQFLNALEALKAVEGELPCNIMFLAEGQENLGSPDYAKFIERYKDRLAAGAAAFCPGAVQRVSGDVPINAGFKGLIYLRITASGKRMGVGPQDAPMHGRFQGLVESPVWHLLEGLCTLTSDGGKKIEVEGFYADHQEPTEEERKEVRSLIAGKADQPWQQLIAGTAGAKTSLSGLSGEEAYLRYFFDPSFNINGLNSGYVGPGSPVFTIPHRAWTLMDVRVPRGYSSRRTVERIKAHLEKNGFGDLEVETLAAHEPFRTSVDDPWVHSVIGQIEERGVKVDVMPFTGGGGPWSLFASDFGMPVLFDVGLGHGGKAGQPDEYLVIDGNDKVADMVDCEMFYAKMLKRFAGLS